ncbi:MAG: hypothetical protein LBL47_01655 [Lactobacillus sp.]|jgi:hypothetical protein|nr:hypothetical protein [Lactobacillus sp.]
MAIEKILVDSFEILENGDEVGISFQLKEAAPTEGEFVYDGGNCAILIRDNTKAFLFTNIIPELRAKLVNAKEIMMLEEEGEEIVNSYTVEVRKVDKVPFEDTLTEDLYELMLDLRDVYGEEGVERISKELWEVK